MSEDTDAVGRPEDFAAAAVPLLCEYQQKMAGIHARLRELKDIAVRKPYGADTTARVVAAEFYAVKEFLSRFRPAALTLARQVSGMIDQGRLTPLERAELQLRLAEFESLLIELPKLFTAYQAA